MLSPDVPEFVPRGNQTHPTNRVNFKPQEGNNQAQQSKSPASTHRPKSHARADPPLVPESSPSWRERGQTSGPEEQNNPWRQPRKTFGNQRESQTHEINKHESSTNNPRENNSATPKRTSPQKGKGRPNTVIENLELHIKNKFTTTSKPPYSYTKILQSKQSVESNTKAVSVKQQDFNNESQWPALQESLPPHKMTERKNELHGAEKSSGNPWVQRSNEGSPMKSPAKNLWQERGTAKQNGDVSVKPKSMEISSPTNCHIKNAANPWHKRGTAEQNGYTSQRLRNTDTSSPNIPPNPWHSTGEQPAGESMSPEIIEENPKTSKNSVKTKLASHTPQGKAETNSPLSHNDRLERKTTNVPKDNNDMHDKEQGSKRNYARTAMNTEPENIQVVQGQEAVAQVTKNTTTQEDSDLFQWKVIGEKKKKVKIKPEEEVRSPQSKPHLRSVRNKYDRVLPDQPSQKYEFDLSKRKGAHPLSSKETQGAIKADAAAPKAGQKERKKSRPTKVTSLANCTTDRRETRPHRRTATTTTTAAATVAKPLDEETIQRKLAAKQRKMEEKRKLRELKASEALRQPKDTKVSVITKKFLAKTHKPSKAPAQHSSQTTVGAEGMDFTSLEEYPSLNMQRNPPSHRDIPHMSSAGFPPHRDAGQDTASSLQSDRDETQATSVPYSSRLSLPLKVAKKSPSLRGQKADDLPPSLLQPDSFSDGDSDAWEECDMTNYKMALLSAKVKETKPDYGHAHFIPDSSIETAPPKKNVKTRDKIELDLFAIASKPVKNKKKDSAERYSFVNRRHFEENKENRQGESRTKKTGGTASHKGVGVVAKRGIIDPKKQPKKKISRVQRCKMEKRQREILALQLLLEPSKVKLQEQQIQDLLKSLPTRHQSSEKFPEAGSVGGGSDTPGGSNTATETHTDQEEDKREPVIDEDKNEQKPSQKETDEKTEDYNKNNESEASTGASYELLDINTPAVMTPTDEGNASNQPSTENGPKLITDDPLIKERVSELSELLIPQGRNAQGLREYCHQVVTPEVNAVAKELIKSILAFQRRHYLNDPTKARMRKRFVCGLKETTKLMGKMSCIIMAPNIQQCEGQGSLDDAVDKLLNQAEKLKVPVVFALSTKELRKLYHKPRGRVSCFGIISYQGAQDTFQHLMQLIPEAQKQYQQLVASGQCTVPKEGEEGEEEEGEDELAENDLKTKVLAHTTALLMAP